MAKTKEKKKARQRKYADMDRRLTEHSTGSNRSYRVPQGVKRFDPKDDGSYELDFIPYTVGKRSKDFRSKLNFAAPGEDYFERTFYIHRGIGPNRETVTCPAMTFDKPCYICKQRSILLSSTDEDDRKAGERLRPSQRQLFLVFDRNKPKDGLQLWEISNYAMGAQLDKKVNNADEDDKPRWKKFWYAGTDGRTVRLIASEEATGDGGGKYLFFDVDKFKKRTDPVPEEVENHDICLDDLVIEEDADTLKKLYTQGGDEDGDEDDDKENKGKAKKKAKPDDDDDDDDDDEDEDEDDDDDDDDKPAKKWSKGDDAKTVYKGKTYTGTVVKVDKENDLIHLGVEGRDKPLIVKPDDLEPVDDEGDDDDEDDDKPAKKGKEKTAAKKGGKKKPADDDGDDDEDEEEDDEDDDDDDDDDDKPAKKGKDKAKAGGKKAKADDDDDGWGDDDDDDDEGDDEDEDDDDDDKPAKGKKKPPAKKGKK